MRAMVIRTPFLSGYDKVRHLEVSLSRIDCLIADLPGKYVEPGTLPPSTDGRQKRVSLRTGGGARERAVVKSRRGENDAVAQHSPKSRARRLKTEPTPIHRPSSIELSSPDGIRRNLY